MGGSISEEEWNALLKNEDLCKRLCDAADLDADDLKELFLAWRALGKGDDLEYDAFVDHLKVNSKLADRRSILLVMTRIRDMELGIERRFSEMSNLVTGTSQWSQSAHSPVVEFRDV